MDTLKTKTAQSLHVVFNSFQYFAHPSDIASTANRVLIDKMCL